MIGLGNINLFRLRKLITNKLITNTEGMISSISFDKISLHSNTSKTLTAIRLFLAAFFIFSGGAKFWSLSSFIRMLASYSFIPEIFVNFFSYGIPAIEIVLGVFLLFAYHVPKVSFSLLIMVFIYTVVAFIKYQNGEITNCGCFGELIERRNDWRLFVENTGVMFLLALVSRYKT